MTGNTQRTKSKPPRVCAECGGDRWQARDAERLRNEAYNIRRLAETMARDAAIKTLNTQVAEITYKDERARLQRKITKQARVIRRLEEKLRELGQKPYEGMGHDTAPGAEYDAGQPLPGDNDE